MSRTVINILVSQNLNEIADYFFRHNLDAEDQFLRTFNCHALARYHKEGWRNIAATPLLHQPLHLE